MLCLKNDLDILHHFISLINSPSILDLGYSGTRNDVDTTAVFTAVFEGFMTLRANNFSSGGTLVMFLVFIWRMKCFLSILVIEYPISPFLVSWGRFLSTSKSTPTQDYISKKSPPNLSSLLADCRAEVWTNHSHEAKNNYTGYFFDWHWQKTFQSSNSFRIQHQKLANLRIILIQSQNIPQNSCKKQLIVWIILSTTVLLSLDKATVVKGIIFHLYILSTVKCAIIISAVKQVLERKMDLRSKRLWQW